MMTLPEDNINKLPLRGIILLATENRACHSVVSLTYFQQVKS